MTDSGDITRTIWQKATDPEGVWIIDQRWLPFSLRTERLVSVEALAVAIRDMRVRGAGCIGATAAWGMFLAARECRGSLERLEMLAQSLKSTRPTAVNLAWAVDRVLNRLRASPPAEWIEQARMEAGAIGDEDVESCRRIGEHGLRLITELREQKGKAPHEPVRILTHCNAGWLAFVEHGSATSPIYAAHSGGMPIFIWVDETRPRNQGARLTAWELAQRGVPHQVIVDNAGGHLMQRGLVDAVIVGADRVTCQGDVANKIGTYLKALAAQDNGIPFWVALPSSTIDWSLCDGLREIPIEERGEDEVTHLSGMCEGGKEEKNVRLVPAGSGAANPAFDVTPARLVSTLITERGTCAATREGLLGLFPERSK